jgi:hypothetical protein
VLRLLCIVNTSYTCFFVYSCCTFFVVAQIAFAFLVTNKEKEFIFVSYKYMLKTSKISISLLRLTKLLIVFIAIYNIISLLMFLFFNLY